MIKLNKVTKSFNDFKAINNLSLKIKKGEIYGLLGPNGAGKSTTINILLGFLRPDSGSAKISDICTSTKFDKTRKITGYISENVSLYPYLTGLENLDYFCKVNGQKIKKSNLESILIKSGLQESAHNVKIENYSKGMRQKVGIAIALAKNASVYLLDEPASGLDPLASNDLSSLLKKISKEGSTILMASHDIFRIRETCDRIGILKNGQLVNEMKTSEVSTKEIEKIYIDYMQK